MAITVEEIFETANMILRENLDIRTTTLGINLKDCVHSDFGEFKKNVYQKIGDHGSRLIKEARKLEQKYGLPIVNKRIAVTPISLIMEGHCQSFKFLQMAQTLDRAAKKVGIDFIGGFGGLCQKGLTRSDKLLIDSLPTLC